MFAGGKLYVQYRDFRVAFASTKPGGYQNFDINHNDRTLVVHHPNYNPVTRLCDATVINFKNKKFKREHILPLCGPGQSFDSARYVGMGRTEVGLPHVLQEALGYEIKGPIKPIMGVSVCYEIFMFNSLYLAYSKTIQRKFYERNTNPRRSDFLIEKKLKK